MGTLSKLMYFVGIAGSWFGYCQVGSRPSDLAIPSGAQSQTLGAPGWPTVNLNLILLDSGKRPAVPKTVPEFQVLEDGDLQTVRGISGPGSPVSLCIEIAASSLPDDVHDAVISLINQLPPQSEVMIVAAADKGYLVLPFIPASAAGGKFPGWRGLKPTTRKSFLSSIGSTEEYFRQSAHNPRRALVIVTAGIVDYGHDFDETVHSMLVPSAPLVYVLPVRRLGARPFDPEDQLHMNAFALFVEPTGGVSLTPSPGETGIQARVSQLSRDIDSQYALTYLSTHKRADKTFHQVSVSDPRKPLHLKIQSAAGYYVITP